MTQFREGARVLYVGDGDHDLQPGDRGRVLSAEDAAAHVLWMSGAQEGNLILHDNLDLVIESAQQTYDVDLYGTPLVSVAVRTTFDRFGPDGLLNALNEEGHLATFSPIAEEALGMVAQRIREEPAFKEVLGELDVEEAEDLVSLAAFVLLRDSFGEER